MASLRNLDVGNCTGVSVRLSTRKRQRPPGGGRACEVLFAETDDLLHSRWNHRPETVAAPAFFTHYGPAFDDVSIPRYFTEDAFVKTTTCWPFTDTLTLATPEIGLSSITSVGNATAPEFAHVPMIA